MPIGTKENKNYAPMFVKESAIIFTTEAESKLTAIAHGVLQL